VPVAATPSAAQVGLAPSASMAMTYIANAQSIGTQMENAVAAQQRGQVLAEAAVANIVAMILAQGVSS
jgi:hypothetical protein